MNLKKTVGIGTIIALLIIVATITPVSAITPPYPVSDYIQDVRAGNSDPGKDPLDLWKGGVSILTTSDGDNIGLVWMGAWTMSGWAIESWESQTGESWPYQWRSRKSVAREIQVHSWIYDTTRRRTTISFFDGSRWG